MCWLIRIILIITPWLGGGLVIQGPPSTRTCICKSVRWATLIIATSSSWQSSIGRAPSSINAIKYAQSRLVTRVGVLVWSSGSLSMCPCQCVPVNVSVPVATYTTFNLLAQGGRRGGCFRPHTSTPARLRSDGAHRVVDRRVHRRWGCRWWCVKWHTQSRCGLAMVMVQSRLSHTELSCVCVW